MNYGLPKQWQGHNVALAVGITAITILCFFILKIALRRTPPPPPPLNGKLTHTNGNSDTTIEKLQARIAKLEKEKQQILDDQIKNHSNLERIYHSNIQEKDSAYKRLKLEKDGLTQQNQDLAKQLQALQQQLLELTSSKKTLEATVKDLEQDKEASIAQFKETEKLIAELKQTLTEKNQQDLETQASDHEAKIATLIQTQQVLENQVAHLEKQIEDLTQRNKTLNNDKEALLKDNKDLQQTIATLNIEVATLRDSQKDVTSPARTESPTKALEQQLEDLKETHTIQLKTLQQDLTETRDTIAKIESSNQAFDSVFQNILNYLNTHKEPDLSLIKLLMPLTQINGYSEHLQTIEKYEQRCQESQKTRLKEAEQKQQKAVEITQQQSLALTELTTERDQLLASQQLLKDTINTLNSEKTNLTEQMSELQAQLQTTLKHDKILTEEVSRSKKQIEELEQQLQEASSREEKLRTQLTNETDYKSNISAIQADEHQALEDLKSELSTLKSTLQPYKVFVEQIQGLLESLLKDPNVSDDLKKHIQTQLERFKQVALPASSTEN